MMETSFHDLLAGLPTLIQQAVFEMSVQTQWDAFQWASLLHNSSTLPASCAVPVNYTLTTAIYRLKALDDGNCALVPTCFLLLYRRCTQTS